MPRSFVLVEWFIKRWNGKGGMKNALLLFLNFQFWEMMAIKMSHLSKRRDYHLSEGGNLPVNVDTFVIPHCRQSRNIFRLPQELYVPSHIKICVAKCFHESCDQKWAEMYQTQMKTRIPDRLQEDQERKTLIGKKSIHLTLHFLSQKIFWESHQVFSKASWKFQEND